MRRASPIRLPLVLLALAVGAALSACTAQLRNIDQATAETRFQWCQAERRAIAPRILQKELNGKTGACDRNDLGMAQMQLGLGEAAVEEWQAALSAGSAEAAWNLLRFFSILEDQAAIASTVNAAAEAGINNAALAQMADRCVAPDQAAERNALFVFLWNQRQHPPAGMKLASDALAAGDYPQAERILDSILQRQPERAEGYFGLGYIRYRAADYSRAAPLLEQALRKQTREAQACVLAMESRLQLADARGALAALALCPNALRNRRTAILEGLAQLRLDYRANLQPILARFPAAEDRRALLREWYSTESEKGIQAVSDEWRYLQ